LEVIWTVATEFKSAMKNPLELRPDQVSDAASFLEFVRSLVNERRQIARNAIGTESLSATKEWRSSTIEDFLDAAIRWAEDSQFGQRQGLGTNPWKQFAVFLYCGKIYE
jgi:hypothetical protein